MKIQHFFETQTSTLSYVVHAGKDAVVIDPVRDYDPKNGRTSWTSAEQIAAYIDREGLRVHYVIDTHAHADHTGGFDELRRFNELSQKHLPVYAGPDTAAILRERFSYGFDDVFPFYGGKPDLTLHEVRGPFEISGKTIVPIPVTHGRTNVLGYRFGPLAYITDAKTIPESSIELLRGVDTLVINALRERPHPTHLSFAEALGVSEQIAPRRAYLVHLSHETSHVAATALLPPGVEVATDGLTITVEE